MGDYFEENKAFVLVCGLVILVLGSQAPQINASWQAQSKGAEAARNDMNAAKSLAAKEESAKAFRDIANARYDAGVEVVVDFDRNCVASNITKGQPIVAGAHVQRLKKSKQKPAASDYIGAGTVVGDLYGTTAVMEHIPQLGYAVASQIAVTNDRNRMDALKKRFPCLTRPGVAQ